MITVWRARLTTRHFSFEAFGDSADSATKAMRGTLEVHARQYSLPPDWWSPDAPDIALSMVGLGAGYRDGEVIFP